MQREPADQRSRSGGIALPARCRERFLVDPITAANVRDHFIKGSRRSPVDRQMLAQPLNEAIAAQHARVQLSDLEVNAVALGDAFVHEASVALARNAHSAAELAKHGIGGKPWHSD